MPKLEDYHLRSLLESDLERVLHWRNSDRIRSNMYTDHIISFEEHYSWFKRLRDDKSSVYKICDFQNRSIGLVNAIQIETLSRRCSWAFYLGEVDTPPGSGACIEFLFLEQLFEEINIRKVCCEVFAFNKTTIKLHKKFGFQEEGVLKQHVFKNGKYEDVVSLALFIDEWLIIKHKMQRLCFGDDFRNETGE